MSGEGDARQLALEVGVEPRARVVQLADPIGEPEPHVVAGLGIAGARIPEAYDKFDRWMFGHQPAL